MDFSFTDEQLAFKDACFKFSRNEIMPMMEEYELKGEFPWPAWKKMAEYGMMGLPFPEEYGGAGADILTTLLGMEGLGHGGASAGITLAWGAHTILCGVPIWLVGNEAQGLPADYQAACDVLVKMPMLGKADSLNAAVATAVMAYEIVNQRRDD